MITVANINGAPESTPDNYVSVHSDGSFFYFFETEQEAIDFRNTLPQQTTEEHNMELVVADLELRRNKLNDVITYMRTQLIADNTKFTAFIVDSRLSRDDYANGTDTFITWVNNTFPTKTYYTLARKTELLNILNG